MVTGYENTVGKGKDDRTDLNVIKQMYTQRVHRGWNGRITERTPWYVTRSTGRSRLITNHSRTTGKEVTVDPSQVGNRFPVEDPPWDTLETGLVTQPPTP